MKLALKQVHTEKLPDPYVEGLFSDDIPKKSDVANVADATIVNSCNTTISTHTSVVVNRGYTGAHEKRLETKDRRSVRTVTQRHYEGSHLKVPEARPSPGIQGESLVLEASKARMHIQEALVGLLQAFLTTKSE